MRASQFLLRTRREVPSDAVEISHQLMLRTGMMHQVSAGVYTLLPLGNRVLKKIETIVREEMNATGAQEVLMPALIPQELWEETGRWNSYGPNMMHVQDRRGKLHGLGPTHEEPITDVARMYLQSHRDLPVNLYQIQTKFRGEQRPRGGVLRCLEFRMKDAYSFDVNPEAMQRSFEAMNRAYDAMFTRMGFDFTSVTADSGAIGGDNSVEFIAPTPRGDVTFLRCNSCNYGSNEERAKGLVAKLTDVEAKPMEEIVTPNLRTVEELRQGLPGLGYEVPRQGMIKTIIYGTDNPDKPLVAVMVMGDDEVNEVKLSNILGGVAVEKAGASAIEEATGAPKGFAGPIGMPDKVHLYIDERAIEATDVVFGVNRLDSHAIHGNPRRDITHSYEIMDARVARDGDLCSSCGDGILSAHKGIELGHTFQLEQVYSRPMNATFTQPDGTPEYFWMGCYGIGTSRAIAAAIEQHHDADGLVLPASIAPFEVTLVPTLQDNRELMEMAGSLHTHLENNGHDVLFDDRHGLSIPARLKDADLIGSPVRVMVGRDFDTDGKIEVSSRKTRETVLVKPEDVPGAVQDLLYI